MLMGWALIGIYILCAIHAIAAFTDDRNDSKDRTKKRKIDQSIGQKQQKQVSNIIGHKQSFQSYHFQLDTKQRSVQFYLDTEVNDQIKAYVKVLWKHKNAFILPSTLKSERVEVTIYENEDQVETQRFYTKAAFIGNAQEDKVYKLVVSHKKQAKITKLITLSVEQFFQSYESTGYEAVDKGKQKPWKKNAQKSRNKNKKSPVLDEEQSSSSESSSQAYKDHSFKLSQVQQRVQLLLNETKVKFDLGKLLINEAETKHLAEYTVEKYIEDSIKVYWMYEIVECGIVVLCVIVEMMMVHKLFHDNRIQPLI